MANDAREPAFNLPIPHPDNDIAEEFPRIGIAFTMVGAALDAFTTALAGKAATNHGHAIADVAGLGSALDGKAAASHSHALDSLSDVASAGASAGQVLAFGSSGWQPVTLNAASVGALPETAVSTFGASLTDDADAAEARATLGLGSSALTSDDRVAYGNTNSVIAGAARVAALTAALTAPRTWTLPAANAAGAPPYILIVDEAGGISATNTLTLAAGGGDTINGAATLVLTVPRSVVVLTRNGATRWTALQAAGAPNAAALPSSPVGALTANNVQAALEELDADLTAGLNSKLGTGHAGAGGAAHALATALEAGFMSPGQFTRLRNVSRRTQLFTASSTWVVPADVTEIRVTVVGGGGGGTSGSAAFGGSGGVSVGTLTVTPGASLTVTVGQGGNGVAGVSNAFPGGTSSFQTLSATGGGGGNYGSNLRGANGAGSGGNIHNSVASGQLIVVPPYLGSTTVQRPTGTTAPIAFSTTSPSPPGAGGGASIGGISGIVLIEWIG
jgi:hypothetical protein